MPRGIVQTKCKSCGRAVEECGPLSATYQCQDCGRRRAAENHIALRSHSGQFFDHWRRRMAASVGAVIPDE